MNDHLSTQGKPDPRGGFVVSGVQKKFETLPIGTSGALKIVKKQIRIEKVMAPPSK
jgi:hypothetical protein